MPELEKLDYTSMGFKTTTWSDLKVGQRVWIAGKKEDKPYAYGPHFVFNPEKRELQNEQGKVFMHYPDDLLKYTGIFDGYTEAQNIDRIIGQKLKDHTPSVDNCLEWLKFLRTVGTTINIIETECKDLLKRSRYASNPDKKEDG